MNRIKTLIVDESEDFNSTLSSYLTKLNCDVINNLSNGQDIIKTIVSEAPDIVFLNINFLDKNDFEIIQEITNRKIHNMVWVICGEKDSHKIKPALEYGAVGFVNKPFTSINIQEAIETYHNISNKRKTFTSHTLETKVMLADDEPLMRDLLEKILEDCNCVIEDKFSSGQEIIDTLCNGKAPEMTFLDIEMPEGNGLDVLKYIKENNIPTFTVMVSGHGTFHNVKVAIDAGADGFIVKPFSRKKVEQMIEKYHKRKILNS